MFCGKIFLFCLLRRRCHISTTHRSKRTKNNTNQTTKIKQAMIPVRKLIAAIVALVCIIGTAEAFPRRAIPSGTTRCVVAGGTRLASAEDPKESEHWTLQEDWALMDNVSKFTVSSTTETKTFWTQLWSANAILFSAKQPKELYKRAQQLDSHEITDHPRTKHKTSPSLKFGPSPLVLEHWKIETEGDCNRVVGQINTNGSGQRTIWFHYHVIGRLEGDPFADSSSSTVSLFPGGYIEAVGGRIYELGQPMVFEDWSTDKPKAVGTAPQETPETTSNESTVFSKWWIPGSTAAISALVSSTILSACIGYGAGLSIISDSSHHPTTPPTPTMLTVESVLAGPSHSTASNTLPTQQTASTEELRARTQYRVVREEKLLQRISERLELDKQHFKQLEEQQKQEESPSQLRP